MYLAGEWHPGINDPTVEGWVIASGYIMSAAVCSVNGTRAIVMLSRRFWHTLSGVMLLLGVNKQLDFQTFVWLEGRKIARQEGWYEDRIWAQSAMTILVSLAAVGLLYVLFRMSRYERTEARVAMLGMLMLCIFVVVRSISYHPVDEFFAVMYGGWKLHRIIEMVGVFTVLSTSILARVRGDGQTPRTR